MNNDAGSFFTLNEDIFDTFVMKLTVRKILEIFIFSSFVKQATNRLQLMFQSLWRHNVNFFFQLDPFGRKHYYH